jgi:hypothetical protein
VFYSVVLYRQLITKGKSAGGQGHAIPLFIWLNEPLLSLSDILTVKLIEYLPAASHKVNNVSCVFMHVAYTKV